MYAYENLSLEDMPNEHWRGFHGGKFNNYFVSNYGRIKSVEKKTNKAIIKRQRLKKHVKKKDGSYHERLYTKIRENGRNRYKGVSRLVAEAFIPNSNNLPV